MKKLILALVLVLVMSVPAFALGDIDIDLNNNPSATATGGAGGTGIGFGGSVIGSGNSYNTIKNDVSSYSKSSASTVTFDYQSQFGYVAPVQSVTFVSPPSLTSTAGLSELNFGNGRMKDVTKTFADFSSKVKKFDPTKELLDGQVDQVANEPMKRFIGKASDLLKKYDANAKNYRYVVLMSEANKTLQSGVNLNGAGTGVSSTMQSAGGGGGLLGFQGGITKGWDLYMMVIVKVIPRS